MEFNYSINRDMTYLSEFDNASISITISIKKLSANPRACGFANGELHKLIERIKSDLPLFPINNQKSDI